MPESCSDFAICTVLFHILERVQIFLSGTHFDDLSNGVDEDLTVSDMPGRERLFGGLDHGVYGDIADDDLHLDLRQESCIQFHAAVSLPGAFLDAAAHDLRDGHAGDADLVHGFSQDVISG